MVLDSDGKPIRYSSLIPVYSLNILGYNHFQEDKDALRIFELYDPKRNKRFGKELLKIGFFELKKENIETENQRRWRDYFLTGEVDEDAPEYIKKASRTIEYANLGEEERNMASAVEKAEATYQAVLYGSYLEGKDEGKAEGMAVGMAAGMATGRTEGLYEVARKLLRRNRPIAEIMEDTGLTLEEIEKLKL